MGRGIGRKRFKLITPSKSTQAETKNQLKSHEKTDYIFTKRINRLSSRRDIEYVLNHEPNNETKRYYGQINGVEVRIDFDITKTPLLRVKQENHLEPTYHKILDIIFRRAN